MSFAGNAKLKIYGTSHCSSGKRMKKENRVFFCSEKEALKNGYRTCGHCMRETYTKWKNSDFKKIPRSKIYHSMKINPARND